MRGWFLDFKLPTLTHPACERTLRTAARSLKPEGSVAAPARRARPSEGELLELLLLAGAVILSNILGTLLSVQK